MAKTTASQNGFFGQDGFFGVDAVVETQRKNVEALTQANQLAVEAAQAMARRQVELMRQAIEETSTLVRAWTQPEPSEDRLAKNIEAAKQTFAKALANAREMNELSAKASAEMFGVIAKRLSEGFDEACGYAKRQIAAE
jgi:phasin family protein